MLDFLIILCSILLGIVCSVFINRFITPKTENKSKLPNDIKSKLNNLAFEKDVALEALDKINRYVEEKKIDMYEKDRLLLKYRKLLEHYDEQLFKLQPIVEVQEIYEYRKQIFSLISDSIAKLDKRLSNFSNYVKEGENRNIDKEDVIMENKPELHSIPITQKIINNSKLDILHKYINSLYPFGKSKKKEINLVNTGLDNISKTFSPIVNNTIDENDQKNGNNEDNYEKNNVSNIEKNNLGDLDIEEINTIQKDILKILQRLENTSVKV